MSYEQRPAFTVNGKMRSLEEATSEVDRELQVRRRCYAQWVQDGKMSSVDATDRFARLEAARSYLDLVPKNAAEARQQEAV